ncbi:GNAT family N-acetyltransferase [Microlunatus panaciterrae]|uniref:RimJ/RimL family protein N-acetyltransferase n=1 Tax=Microlunatus panaciterrae TaxID=400768 RepID=A0ABS2REC0_9ACTN|nr:GNAT family N-acetyltransferase [Microlunatus panaciterrae]MBM7797336.1 RimJ/RimL family protein N-acetyltransferase [Microlunatus panaciterrae]
MSAVEIFLQTERLLLRRFTPDDVDHLVRLDSDPAVMRYITGGAPTSRQEIAEEHIPAYLRYYREYAGYGFWAVVERRTGEFIGWFHLRPGPAQPPDAPELGYRFVRASWGQGFATEGSLALIRKAFLELGASRVNANTMVMNTASRRVMEKAGLTQGRIFVGDWPVAIPGDEEGDVEYAADRAEWLAWDAARAAGSGGPDEGADRSVSAVSDGR